MKGKRTAFLSSAMDTIRHWNFFAPGFLPKINPSGFNSFYLFHAFYHQLQWRCNPFYHKSALFSVCHTNSNLKNFTMKYEGGFVHPLILC
jgi:hypothetical protein